MFRHADGSGNNLENPDLGRSGTPYARSVQGKYGLPRSSLPDPGLVFDTILKRQRVSSFIFWCQKQSLNLMIYSKRTTLVACPV